jgi:antitoxin component of MazEF toxin-antitoxin module
LAKIKRETCRVEAKFPVKLAVWLARPDFKKRLPVLRQCAYSYYMKAWELQLTRIGNSRGIRLPAKLIRHYGFGGGLAIEARDDGLLLKANRPGRLSWRETASAMEAAAEDWGEWDSLAAEGLENSPWEMAPTEAKTKNSRRRPKSAHSPVKR